MASQNDEEVVTYLKRKKKKNAQNRKSMFDFFFLWGVHTEGYLFTHISSLSFDVFLNNFENANFTKVLS